MKDSHTTRRGALCRIGTALFAGATVASGQTPLAASPVQAQNNPLLGSWSSRTTNTRGEALSVIFVTFHADGRFHQRIIVPAGIIDYVGTYRLSADGRTLHSTYLDYSPKQLCGSGVCYPVPSGVPMNQTISTHLAWLQHNLFLSEDAGGMLRWVRQA